MTTDATTMYLFNSARGLLRLIIIVRQFLFPWNAFQNVYDMQQLNQSTMKGK